MSANDENDELSLRELLSNILCFYCFLTQDLYETQLTITDTTFDRIHCKTSRKRRCSVFRDNTNSSTIEMESISLSDTDAVFYDSNHSEESVISINNLSVETEALYDLEDADDAMLYFNENDQVQLNQLRFNYSYNMASCNYSHDIDSSDSIGYDAEMYQCRNPQTLISNHGEITITDFQINSDITNGVNAFANRRQYRFNDIGDHGFIENHGVMNIDKLRVNDPYSWGYHMFYNDGNLTLNEVVFDFDKDSFDANPLRSRNVIRSEGSRSSLNITNSEFDGGDRCLSARGDRGGRLNVHNSSFRYLSYPINIHKLDNVHIEDSTFVGYNEDGLLQISNVSNVSLEGNTFEIDADGVLYDINPNEVGLPFDDSISSIKQCDDVELVDNQFVNNPIDTDAPWVSLDDIENTACFSGNKLSLNILIILHFPPKS